jgi:hypothetical protein
MVHALAELFAALHYGLAHSSELIPRFFNLGIQLLLRVFKVAALPEVLLLFIVAVIAVTAFCSIIAALHVVILGAIRPRATVFVSYHHEQENVAELIARELQRRSINSKKMPFVDAPDHDAPVQHFPPLARASFG